MGWLKKISFGVLSDTKKSGDGGAAAAQQAEIDRQERIKAATAMINNIFDGVPDGYGSANFTPSDALVSGLPAHLQPWAKIGMKAGGTMNVPSGLPKQGYRQALYDEHKRAVTDLNRRDVDRQYADASRQNRFGLARSGLFGGSVDVDSNERLRERYDEGVMRAVGIGDSAAADLRTQDERARQNLIGMAQTGIDTGTAQQMAMRNLEANAKSAEGQRAGATIGSLFGDLGQAYMMRQYQQGMTARSPYAQQYANLSTNTGDSGTILR